jgi:Ca2+/Na+ antiporter
MLNEKKEFYYINMGILLYLFGSTILFLVGNLTVTLSREFTKIPWILNALFYVFYQLFVLYEWKKSFSKKELETNL